MVHTTLLHYQREGDTGADSDVHTAAATGRAANDGGANTMTTPLAACSWCNFCHTSRIYFPPEISYTGFVVDDDVTGRPAGCCFFNTTITNAAMSAMMMIARMTRPAT